MRGARHNALEARGLEAARFTYTGCTDSLRRDDLKRLLQGWLYQDLDLSLERNEFKSQRGL